MTEKQSIMFSFTPTSYSNSVELANSSPTHKISYKVMQKKLVKFIFFS